MTTRSPQPEIFDQVRCLVLGLLKVSGVEGVVLLDRQDRLILHEGAAPSEDVAGLAASLLRSRRAADRLLQADVPTVPCLVQGGDDRAYVDSCGRGTTLLVFLDSELPGSLCRGMLGPSIRALESLLEELFAQLRGRDDVDPPGSEV